MSRLKFSFLVKIAKYTYEQKNMKEFVHLISVASSHVAIGGHHQQYPLSYHAGAQHSQYPQTTTYHQLHGHQNYYPADGGADAVAAHHHPNQVVHQGNADGLVSSSSDIGAIGVRINLALSKLLKFLILESNI